MLKFEGKDWQEYGLPELGVMLWHPAKVAPRISWNLELRFLPAGVDWENEPGRPRRYFYVDVYGYLPGPMDWRDLEGRVFEPVQEAHFFGPDIHVSSSGPGDVLWKGPETMACMIHFRKRDGWKFQVEISAWFTREASKLWQIRQMCKQLVPAGGDDEEEEELPEEWTQSRDLYWIGEILFAQINCTVPANAPHPHDLAKRMAKAALNLTEFQSVHLNGEVQGKPTTREMGMSNSGRLVILNTAHF